MIIVSEAPHTTDGFKNQITCLRLIKEPSKGSAQPFCHYHDCIEILYAINSDCDVWISGECQKFSTGDMVIVNANEPHYVSANAKSEYICIQFVSQLLYSNEKSLQEFKYVMPFLFGNSQKTMFRKGEIENAEKLCVEIIEEWEAKNFAYELVMRGNILKLFSEIIRYLKDENLYSSNEYITEEFKKAVLYISQNYATASEKEAAKVAGLSYNHFSYMFKKFTGKNFKEYLTGLRINESEKLLLSTDKSITEIAMLTGFSSASHFISKFKSIKGITPLKFKMLISKVNL